MINSTSNPIDNLLTQLLQQRSVGESQNVQKQPKAKPVDNADRQDIVSLSTNASKQSNDAAQSNQDFAEVENGFRRTQNFTTADGREFTRIEEITTTPDRSKRIVIQQLDNGSTTALENVVDRQEDGSFRLIQRFTNEVGETETNVKLNFNPQDANVILGRAPIEQNTANNSPYQNLRGTQIDLSA